MKKKLPAYTKLAALAVAIFGFFANSNSAVFTAVASGNWSSTATWGGNVPSFSNTTDQITIPSGISVTLDNNLSLDGALTQLIVNGSLTSSSNTQLNISYGTLSGNGMVEAGNMVLGSGAALGFTGNLKAVTLSSSALNLPFTTDIMVEESLTLTSGVFNLQTGGKLNIGSNATIIMNGGQLAVNGGTLILANGYSLEYKSAAAGAELSGSGLKNLTIDLGSGNTLKLNNNLEVNGTLALKSGTLSLNGKDLTLKGDVSTNGGGYLASDAASDIHIHATKSFAGKLVFNGTSNSVNNLTVDIGSGNHSEIEGSLWIMGNLSLNSGTLNYRSGTLTLKGNIEAVSNGMISTTSSAKIVVNTATTPSGMLTFSSSGNTVESFTVNITDGGSVVLGSDLIITGSLILTKGKIDVDGSKLKLASGASINGGGSNSYVVTGMTGTLSIQLSGLDIFATTYPVGTSSMYYPASVLLNIGSSGGWVHVGVETNVYANGSSGYDISMDQHLVDATWMVSSDITSNLNMNLKVMWSPSAEVNGFNRSSAYISHYINGKWDTHATAMASSESDGMYSMTRAGITSLSPFAVFDQSTSAGTKEIVKESPFHFYPNPSVENIVIGSMDQPANVEIINLSGQVIGTYVVDSQNTCIPVKDLANGCYTVRLYNNEMNTYQKFVKQ